MKAFTALVAFTAIVCLSMAVMVWVELTIGLGPTEGQLSGTVSAPLVR